MKLSRNQRGIAHLYLILGVVLVVVIGLVGWRVWVMRSDKAPSETASSPSAEKEVEPDLNYIQPPSEAYRVALPEGWTSNTCPDSPNTLFMAPTIDKLGKCNTESGGTVAIDRQDGNVGYGEDYYTSNSYYDSPAYTPMTVDGIEGYRISYYVGDDDGLGYPPIGTQIVKYVLFDGTNTFVITYTRFAGDPDEGANAQAIAESFDKL